MLGDAGGCWGMLGDAGGCWRLPRRCGRARVWRSLTPGRRRARPRLAPSTSPTHTLPLPPRPSLRQVVGDSIQVRPIMYLALTYDHRLIDGREAVTFLRRIKELVEDPARFVLDV
jgi:hypothetical protein